MSYSIVLAPVKEVAVFPQESFAVVVRLIAVVVTMVVAEAVVVRFTAGPAAAVRVNAVGVVTVLPSLTDSVLVPLL